MKDEEGMNDSQEEVQSSNSTVRVCLAATDMHINAAFLNSWNEWVEEAIVDHPFIAVDIRQVFPKLKNKRGDIKLHSRVMADTGAQISIMDWATIRKLGVYPQLKLVDCFCDMEKTYMAKILMIGILAI